MFGDIKSRRIFASQSTERVGCQIKSGWLAQLVQSTSLTPRGS